MIAATYDGDGLRATATTGGTTQDFTWDTQTTQLLMDSTNAYIYTTSDTPTEQVHLSTGTITYLNADSLGSVRGIISSSGSLTATTNFDAWGNPETSGGLTATTPFGYAGAYTDPSGLLYLINRYYDPVTGQFISVDPDLAQTSAPYAYANGNPVTNTDPTGLRVLDGSTRCNIYHSTGNWQVTICIQTNNTGIPLSHVWDAAQIVFTVRSGGIAVAGFSEMGLDVCSNRHNNTPNPNSCSHNNVVAINENVACGGSRTCSKETGQYLSRRTNWLTPWATGVWIHWTNGQHLWHNISITGYQKENGDCTKSNGDC
jgi:RHS repeat-associated protein